jgi:hypothetical protein
MPGVCRKCKIKSSPFIDFTLCPDSPAMLFDDLFDQCESYSCAIEIINTMKALKGPE